MYILYNQDGSVLKKNLTDYIQKGNNNVNEIFVSIVGINYSWTLAALFELPNGDLSSETPTFDDDYEIDGDTYSGWVVPITAAETIYEGILKLSLQADKNTNQTLFTTSVKLVVNPAVAEPDETTITYAQYSALLNLVNQKNPITKSIVVITNTSADVSGYDEGQRFYSKSDNNIYKLASGNLELEFLNYLPKFELTNPADYSLTNLYNIIGTKLCVVRFTNSDSQYLTRLTAGGDKYYFVFEEIGLKERFTGNSTSASAATLLLSAILNESSEYFKPFAEKDYVDSLIENYYTKTESDNKYIKKYESGLTLSSTLAELYALVGSEPSFIKISDNQYDIQWYLVRIVGASTNFYNFEIEAFTYPGYSPLANYAKGRWVGSYVNGNVVLSNLLITDTNVTNARYYPYALAKDVGTKLYKHSIGSFSFGGPYWSVVIISTDATPFTSIEDIHNSYNKILKIIIDGLYTGDLYQSGPTTYGLFYNSYDFGSFTTNATGPITSTITDSVTDL